MVQTSFRIGVLHTCASRLLARVERGRLPSLTSCLIMLCCCRSRVKTVSLAEPHGGLFVQHPFSRPLTVPNIVTHLAVLALPNIKLSSAQEELPLNFLRAPPLEMRGILQADICRLLK